MYWHSSHGHPRGTAGLVAEQVLPVAEEKARTHPRFKYFKEAGEDTYQSFLGVPLIDRGVLQGVRRCRPSSPASSAKMKCKCWSRLPARSRPSARLAPSIASSHLPRSGFGPSPAIFGGAGITIPAACFATDPIRWRQLNHNPISLLAELPLSGIELMARELVLHGRINYAYRRQREYLEADRTWGARHAGILRPRPVAYFSAEFGLHVSIRNIPGGSVCSPVITSKAPPIWAFR